MSDPSLTQPSTCPWCNDVVYVSSPFQMVLCATCLTQQTNESQAHTDYLTGQIAAIATKFQLAQDITSVKTRLAAFQAVDFSQMTDDQVKSTLLDYKQKLDVYFQ